MHGPKSRCKKTWPSGVLFFNDFFAVAQMRAELAHPPCITAISSPDAMLMKLSEHDTSLALRSTLNAKVHPCNKSMPI